MKKSKRYKKQYELIDKTKSYSLVDALSVLKKLNSKAKFDETLEVSFKLNIDTKQSDQNLRGVISLPSGTGKNVRVAVVCEEEYHQAAKDTKADFIGGDELVEKIKKSWTDFDVLITTPSFIVKLRALGKILGPKGLMPNPKTGTVTKNIKEAVKQAKSGRVEFRSDKTGVVSLPSGKISFSEKELKANLGEIFDVIQKNKPAKVKGDFIISSHLSLTMSPAINLDLKKTGLVS